MYFIKAASSISHQQTFRNKGFAKNILPLASDSKLFRADYKEFIDAGLLRRMSEILRMSIACASDCIKQADSRQPDAIIVGTGLGCLFDTEKFLTHALLIKEGLIPPTSFIQSTHNTIAGQISLVHGNHNYNMTHTQNTLSLELALQDAFLNLDEGRENILVGAADENIEQLKEIFEKLGFQNLNLTSGASFFIVSKNKTAADKIQITNTATFGNIESLEQCIDDFLNQNNLDRKGFDLLLYSSLTESVKNVFETNQLVNYTEYSGVYFTNASFAVHLAYDILDAGSWKEKNDVKRILICNNLNPENLGLTIVEKVEA